MSKIDYSKKSYLLNNRQDLIKLSKQVSYCVNTKQDRFNKNTGELILTFEDALHLNSDFAFMYLDNPKDIFDFLECKKINKATWERTKRIKRVIADMLNKSNDCHFLTLTFTDKCLSSTSPETRRKYVTRYLKSQGIRYVANIDFGSKNHREHYHALIDKPIDYKPWFNLCGAIKSEKIHTYEDEATGKRLSKYIAKLTNHAIKETTKRVAIIYSR